MSFDEDSRAYLFGTPGAVRHDRLWNTFAEDENLIGIVFIVDGRKPETFLEAKHIIHSANHIINAPCVVAVNKQDQPDSWDANDIRLILRIEDDIPVVPCVATDKESVKNVLLALMDVILRELEA